MSDVLNLFAGARGWEVGAPDVDMHGLENNDDANATAKAAGFHGHKVDIRVTDPLRWSGCVGLLGSPPCPSFSRAGKRLGILDLPRLERGLALMQERGEWVHPHEGGWHDERSALVLEPLRFIFTLRPVWIALEQVPDVLPLWRLYGKVLATLGYRGAAANLYAEQYGVPQTRKRAILVANREHVVTLPAPTHRKYRKGVGQGEGDAALLPWVAMRDVLDIEDVVQCSNYAGPGLPGATAVERGRSMRELDVPSVTITSKRPRWAVSQHVARSATFGQRPGRDLYEPSFTVTGGGRGGGGAHHLPEWHVDNIIRKVSISEAGALQSFPPDYPWQGTRTAQALQVGNAIPPVLAGAVVNAARGAT